MLKYNSRDLLKAKLRILKCCIANKSIEFSNSIGLGLDNRECLLEEIKILNAYKEVLDCYYPYDCYDYHDYETEYRVWTPEITNWEEDEICYLSLANQEALIQNGLGSVTSDLGFYRCVNPDEANTGYPPVGDDAYWEAIVPCEDFESQYDGIPTDYLFTGSEDQEFVLTINEGGIFSCFSEIDGCCNVKYTQGGTTLTKTADEVLQTIDVTISGSAYTTLSNAITSATNNDNVPKLSWNLLGCRTSLPTTQTFVSYPITVDQFFDTYLDYINTFSGLGNGYLITHEVGMSSVTLTFEATNCNAICYGIRVQNQGEDTDYFNNLGETFDNECAEYDVIITEDKYECQEQCLTDTEANKIINHAMSLCECCTEIDIDLEPIT